MKRLAELRVRAEVENVRTVSFFLQGLAQAILVNEDALFDLDLAIEEAIVNIVHHAYPEPDGGEVLLEFDLDDDPILYVRLTDWGIPFDRADIDPYDRSLPVETRIQGGMGLHLIYNLVDAVIREVTPLGQPNCLVLCKRFDPTLASTHSPSVVRELNAMLEIGRIMTTETNLDQLLDRIITTLVEVVEADRGTIYLIDKATNELYSHILLSEPGKRYEIRLAIGEGIAGEAARLARPINIPDAYADPRFAQDFDKRTGYHTRNILAAPMLNHDQEVVGVVQLLNKLDGSFTVHDERLLSAMASQAAVSIENARLHEQDVAKKLMERELDTARSIQTSFLPDSDPDSEGWQFSSYWLPMREVGGDFYDFHQLADDRLAITIADVSDKGVPAAMFMAMCVTVIRFALTMGLEPVDVLKQANSMILAEQRSRMFATTFLGYFNLKSGELSYASAGHNPPILFRKRTQQCEYLKAKGVALGAFAEAQYEQGITTVESGDILLLFTDGITEAINEHQEEFGEERLGAILKANASQDAAALTQSIVGHVAQFSNNRGHDDETLILIKHL